MMNRYDFYKFRHYAHKLANCIKRTFSTQAPHKKQDKNIEAANVHDLEPSVDPKVEIVDPRVQSITRLDNSQLM